MRKRLINILALGVKLRRATAADRSIIIDCDFGSQMSAPELRSHNEPSTGVCGEGEPAIKLPSRIDIALAVLHDFRDFSCPVIRIHFGTVEALFRRRKAERLGQEIEACPLAAPFAPFLHSVEDRRAAKPLDPARPVRMPFDRSAAQRRKNLAKDTIDVAESVYEKLRSVAGAQMARSA